MEERDFQREFERTEKILKQLPQIKDERSKELIFQNIIARLEDPAPQVQQKNRKSKSWLIPSMTSAAAVLLFAMLIPSIFGGNDDIALEEDMMGSMSALEKSTIEVEDGMSGIGIMAEEGVGGLYIGAIHADEILPNQQATPYALMEGNFRFVVPITVISQSSPELTNLEGNYGLGVSPLAGMEATTSADNEAVLELNVPEELVPIASMETEMFLQALNVAYSSFGYEEVQYFTDGKRGMVLGNYGDRLEEGIMRNKQGYFLHETSTGHQLLVPGAAIFQDLPEASLQVVLENMKMSDIEAGYIATIPDSVTIEEVVENEKGATIVFASGTSLSNTEKTVAMLEAILLTAKDFQYDFVTFENSGIDTVGKYDMTAPVSTNVFINAMIQ